MTTSSASTAIPRPRPARPAPPTSTRTTASTTSTSPSFFGAFENGDECADVNGDDGIDDLDITFFFTSFEQGC